jgi:hypothetical protein
MLTKACHHALKTIRNKSLLRVHLYLISDLSHLLSESYLQLILIKYITFKGFRGVVDIFKKFESKLLIVKHYFQ